MTIEEALAASEAEPVTDDDMQFWIDEHLRVISIPKNGVVAGVEGDKNVNKIKFGMNRYYHGFDMSELSGRILYSNAKGNKNYYNITDMQTNGNTITFSWLVDADAVQYMGKTAFVVYLFKIQGSELRQKFFSTLATLKVLEGMEVDSAVPVEKQTDIIERMKEEISAYAEEVKKSLPADYTAMTEQVNSLKEDKAICSFIAYGSEGNAISVSNDYNTVSFSGETIVIRGGINKVLNWDDIINSAKSYSGVVVEGNSITGVSYVIAYSPEDNELFVGSPSGLKPKHYVLYYHNYNDTIFGLLYDQMLAKKLNTMKHYGECIAYFSLGFVPDITYSGNESTIKFDASKDLIVYGGVKGTFSVSNIITAAKSANLTVNESDNSITGESYVLYVNQTTKKIEATSLTKMTQSNITILYAHHYKSIEFGLLYDQMLAKKTNSRISSLEERFLYVPSYYQAHIKEKSKEILQNMESVGKNGDTFIFITDLHWESNTKNSPFLVKYLEDSLNINTILCGGDLINQGIRETMEENMRETIRAFSTLRICSFPVAFGNHDSNWNNWDGQQNYPERKFDESTQYALMQKQAEDLVTYFTTEGWNFYFDKPSSKTRYIILDTGENGVFSAYSELSKVLSDTLAGYHVVIMAHWLYDTKISTACENIQKMIDAYNSRSSVSISGKMYDFNSVVANICLLLGGHIHKDMSWTTDGGVPVVLTDCDAGRRTENTDYPFVAGTITEQAFDVITLDYINNTVKCVRVGRGANRNFN